jgi:hypothetical protein
MMKAFCGRSSLGIKHGSITFNRGQKKKVEWHHETSRKKFKATSSAGKVVVTAFWDAEEVVLVDIPRVQTSISDMHIQTLIKTFQKRFRIAGRHTNVAEIPFQHNPWPHTSFKTQ